MSSTFRGTVQTFFRTSSTCSRAESSTRQLGQVMPVKHSLFIHGFKVSNLYVWCAAEEDPCVESKMHGKHLSGQQLFDILETSTLYTRYKLP